MKSCWFLNKQKLLSRVCFFGHYRSVCEIVPSALVLFILRKLPPKSPPRDDGQQYHNIS